MNCEGRGQPLQLRGCVAQLPQLGEHPRSSLSPQTQNGKTNQCLSSPGKDEQPPCVRVLVMGHNLRYGWGGGQIGRRSVWCGPKSLKTSGQDCKFMPKTKPLAGGKKPQKTTCISSPMLSPCAPHQKPTQILRIPKKIHSYGAQCLPHEADKLVAQNLMHHSCQFHLTSIQFITSNPPLREAFPIQAAFSTE